MPTPPARPKIYHIVHVDRLASIIADGGLLCDALMVGREGTGTMIGMNDIKRRRLEELFLQSRPGLPVGECVPFYFCPRSIMLFLLHCANHPELSYRGGQGPIVHLVADLNTALNWAAGNERQWAFTLSNAGAYYFEDRCDLGRLDEVNWDAVKATRWSGAGIPGSVKEGKQAEFLVEGSFPWHLVSRIGVKSQQVYLQVQKALKATDHRPRVQIKPNWYY